MLIEWSETADSDLSSIFAPFLAQGEEKTAKDTISQLIKGAGKLSPYPLLGKPGRMEGTREIILRKIPYILVYQVLPDSIKILRVLHTSRLFPESFFDEG